MKVLNQYDVQAVDCNSLRNHSCNWSSSNINSSQASRDPNKTINYGSSEGRGQGTDLCRWIGTGKIVEEMPFYYKSALFEHPFFFCHHLKPSPFADFDDYMLSENFDFLDSEYFPSWWLIFELIFELMRFIFYRVLLIRDYTYWNCYQEIFVVQMFQSFYYSMHFDSDWLHFVFE